MTNPKNIVTQLIVFGGIGLFLFFAEEHIWTYYVAPRDALGRLVNQCEFEADKLLSVRIAEWIDQHNTDVLNPYRRERDRLIETCVKAAGGWCSIGDDAIWPSSRPWAFAPKYSLAKWLYDIRYNRGDHPECSS